MEASFEKNLVQPEYLCSLTKDGLWHKYFRWTMFMHENNALFGYLAYFWATILLV